MLKGQDIVVLLKLAGRDNRWSYRELASELGLSLGEIHNCLARAEEAGLYNGQLKRVVRQSLEEFLIYAAKYVFPAELGMMTFGLPTSYATAPLNESFRTNEEDIVPVWPHPQGKQRGYALAPVHPCVPEAAQKDETLYRRLALLDALRTGRARERELAAKLLPQELRKTHATS